ncbi:MAG: peptidase S41 [Chitinophagaceae bacterium]|nr:MAG: peptidase S41 [Chitinophagaceae bacterium]
MQKTIIALFMLFITVSIAAQNNPLWMRYPAISPDGQTIVFSYKGDLYTVPASGGTATALTMHEAQDYYPVWSHDGKTIAFASDRYGNFDVFTIPATGGAPTRLTFNSAADYPFDFSPDNQQLIFGSGRQISNNNVRFYSPRLFMNLYSIPVTGGKPYLMSEAGVEAAHYNSNGTQVVFQDRKGYEDPWRKHHTSAVTRDIWIMDVKAASYKKISSFEGEDREPVFSNDDKTVYYLSEKNGDQNLYKQTEDGKMVQLTKFKDHPVRHLSRTNSNVFCFSWNGEVYTMKEGDQPKKLAVTINADARNNAEKIVSINGGATEIALAPNGKEIAFVFRGEVFVTSVEGGITKRITNTPQQERMVSWSPDSKKIIYAAERNDNWDIYQSSIVRKEEPYFYAATVLKEEPIIATAEEEFGAQYSPDGKQIGYIAERNILKIYTVADKKVKTILPAGRNYSYSDGDWGFQWSPDSKWIIADDQEGSWQYGNLALIKADGTGGIEKPIRSGFGQNNIKWGMEGKTITWVNERLGRKSIANQGSREVDIYAGFLDQDSYDRMKLSKDEFALLKEKEDKEKKADTTKGKKDSLAKANYTPNLKGFEDRVLRLTINSSSIADYYISADGAKVFYLSAFEKGYDLWVTEPRTRETKILAKLGGSPSGIEPSKDGKTLFLVNNGTVIKVETESGKVSPVGVSGEMVLNSAAERAYIFEHAWRQVQKKFYDPKIHGINWPMYKTNYARFLPHISNSYDFQELLSEMLGELNGSHTGGRYSPQVQGGDATAALGLLYDETFTGNGLKVTEVIVGGPLDKATSKLKAGHIIEKIDGEAISSTDDWAKLLNRKVGKNVLLSFLDPSSNSRIEEIVKPINPGEESALMYKRWVNKMRKMVDELSGGKVGYVHVQGMNDGSFRTVIDEVMGKNIEKEALIVDTRFNGGGWLHDELNTFLSGKRYLDFAPQGNRVTAGEPFTRWQKPSVVLMSEGNYSDAFMFPYSYKQNGYGKLVGMPVAGTGTAVWWETQIDPTIVFGIPMVASIGKENRPTENLQVEPDVRVTLPYEEFIKGKDAQLEAAVKEMLKTIKK